LRIIIGLENRGTAVVELDHRSPKIAEQIYRSLPMAGRANLWGEEVYFETPLEMEDENPSPKSKRGDVSYWAPGSALCIFFGDTQPYSPVNHVGRVVEGMDLFKSVKAGDRIVLRTA
jgi:hypothetical protein